MAKKIFEPLLQLWPQWFATLTVTLLTINIGLANGWTSPYLAQLTDENALFRVTDEEASWIASLLPLGRLLGAVFGPVILEYIGSKMSILSTGLPMIVSWICIIFATSPTWLYVSRILSGTAMGMIVSSYPLYIGEISAPSIRGALVCLIMNGFPVGIFFGNIMGPNMSMMNFSIISLVMMLCHMVIFPFLPQSPYYYVRHNDTKRAEQAIRWYYRKPDIKNEIEAVELFVKSTRTTNIRERLYQMKEPKNRRSFIMMIILFMFMQMSGLNTIVFYMEIILKKGKVTSIMPSTVVIIVGAVSIIIGWMGIFAIDRYGRRILLAISSLGVMIGTVLLGLHFFLLDYGYDSGNLEWLIILSLLLFMMMYFGLIPVPMTTLSEIFPSDLKSLAGFFGSITSAAFAFVASRTYQPLVDLISEKYVFWLYAVIIMMSLIYALTMLPETKGKTLQLQAVCRKSTMDHEADKKKIKKVQWPQWIAGIGVNLLQVQMGLISLWSSPYIAYLTSPESHIPMTMNEASWVVSLLNLGRLIGAISGSVAVNYLGAKTSVFITSLPITLCWLFIIVANRVEWLYVARLLAGISLGKMYSCFSLYLGEIADPSIRGALVALAVSGLSIGNLMMSIMGAYLRMDVSATICLILCVILIIIFIWLPESPHHFVKIKQESKARTSILWYHRDCDVESELQALKLFLEKNRSLPFAEVIKEFKIPYIWKAQILVSLLFMYLQICGLNNVLFYMETILRHTEVTVIKPSMIVIIVTATGIAGSMLSMLLIDKFGRRILTIVSTLAVTISLMCLGIQYQLLDAGYNPATLQALPICSVLLFQIALYVGLVSIPNTVLGEIFPPHIKCVAGCFASIICAISSFISTSTYQPLINLITEKYLFYVYALLLVTAVPYTYFCMPETKGKSLQEIQDELDGRTKQLIS
ncbi:TRET1 protein, partial [Acromyrmex charruanus]